jgi:hypothetical protein
MPWGKKDGQQDPPAATNPPANDPPKNPEFSAEQMLAKMGELLAPLNTRLQAIEERTKPAEPPREPSQLLDNPDGWANEKIGPVAVATVNVNARFTISECMQELRDAGYGDLVPDIKRMCENAPLNVKAGNEFAEYCRNCANMVIGQEARKGGLKRKGSSFILEDANGTNDPAVEAANQDDREFLNYKITLPGNAAHAGKTITRRDFLARNGILIERNGKLETSHDLNDPAVIKAAKESWSKMQVVN